jgi:hypothetical protein
VADDEEERAYGGGAVKTVLGMGRSSCRLSRVPQVCEGAAALVGGAGEAPKNSSSADVSKSEVGGDVACGAAVWAGTGGRRFKDEDTCEEGGMA